MPHSFDQWMQLSLCFALIYIVFRPLVDFLDKVIEGT